MPAACAPRYVRIVSLKYLSKKKEEEGFIIVKMHRKGRTVMERKFMKGNEAIAEAAVRAGCRFYAGYPITPQSEVPEYLSRALPKAGGIFVQGESEVASINMVYRQGQEAPWP